MKPKEEESEEHQKVMSRGTVTQLSAWKVKLRVPWRLYQQD